MTFSETMGRADQVIKANPLSEVEQFRERGIRAAAAEEAASAGPLYLDSREFTAGMRETCIEPVLSSVENWASRRDNVAADLRALIQRLEEEESLPEKRRQKRNTGDEDKEHVVQRRDNDPGVQRIKSDLDQVEREYQQLKDRAGRDAKEYRPFVYWPVLLLIGCIEWFINYPFFENNYVPIVAIGFTALVAIVVAFASHYHGILARQRLELFHQGVKKATKIDQRLWQLFMFLALAAALSWVGWERYSYLEQIYGDVALGAGPDNAGGIPVEQIDAGAKVAQTLIGNLLVWVVGIIWSYLNHDHIPNFSESLHRKKQKQSALEKAAERYTAELDEIDARIRSDLTKVETEHRERMRQLDEAKRKVSRLDEQKINVVKNARNLIEQRISWYHDALCRDIEKSGNGPDIMKDGEKIALVNYKNKTLEFDSESLDRIVE